MPLNTETKQSTRQWTRKEQRIVRSLDPVRVLLPMLLGVVAVLWLLYRQFDPAEFRRMRWDGRVWCGIGLATVLLVLRHLAYSARIRLLSRNYFSWAKSIELITIWEFSAAITPTSLGGSALAFFMLSREKLSAARTATLVLYTIVLDAGFFLLTLPILFALFGAEIIRPGLSDIAHLDGWGYYFVSAYAIILCYAGFFAYGLFWRPASFQRLLGWLTHLPFLRRYRRSALRLGRDMRLASQEMKQQNAAFHLGAIGLTLVIWLCKFSLLCALIVGFLATFPLEVDLLAKLYARIESMFVIVALSPTPGGAGFVEILFGSFLSDYINNSTVSTVVAFIWRLLIFYSYLLVGALVVPHWLGKTLRRQTKEAITPGLPLNNPKKPNENYF